MSRITSSLSEICISDKWTGQTAHRLAKHLKSDLVICTLLLLCSEESKQRFFDTLHQNLLDSDLKSSDLQVEIASLILETIIADPISNDIADILHLLTASR